MATKRPRLVPLSGIEREPASGAQRVGDADPAEPVTVTLVLRPGRGWVRHEPGQYVRVGVDVDGVRLWRSYSITSSPDRPASGRSRPRPDSPEP